MSAQGTRTPLDDAKRELLYEVLRLSGRARIRVFGSSMLPNILPGDNLIIENESGWSPAVGDIVIFVSRNRLFAHRVIRRKERAGMCCYITRGDSLRQNDPLVFPHELLGRVALIIRGGRRIAPDATLSGTLAAVALRNFGFLQTALLWFLSFRQMRSEQCPTQ